LLARLHLVERISGADGFDRLIGVNDLGLAAIHDAVILAAVLVIAIVAGLHGGFSGGYRFSCTGLAFRRGGRGFGFVVVLLLGLAARGGSLLTNQRLAVRNRDLIVIGMNFAERKKAMAVAAIFHERRLKGRFDAGYLRKIDISSKLL